MDGIERTESIEELVEWYNKATLFLNLTYVDNFPTTNIEALACGTPVVTYNTGGSPEAIKDETDIGYTVQKGDLKQVVKVINDFKGSIEIRKKCRAHAEKYFNKYDRYSDYLKIYQSISKK